MNKVLVFILAGILFLLLLIGVLYGMVQWFRGREKLDDALYYWDHARCYKITTQRGSVVRFRTPVSDVKCPAIDFFPAKRPPGMEWEVRATCQYHRQGCRPVVIVSGKW